jgi:hypothetical protein
VSKTLSEAVYAYCEGANARHAKTQGRKLFGSTSGYINALIAKDRGVKPRLGMWKARGESEMLRTKKVRKH